MKKALFSTLACGLLAGWAAPALAQSSAPVPQQAAPEIDSFRVQPVSQLTPGSELVFTLLGTPSAQASLTISNVASNLSMREVEPGRYEGRYTIRSGDAISEQTIVRANLARGTQVSSLRLQEPLVSATGTAPNPGTGASPAPTALAVSQFKAAPVDSLRPGTELLFTLTGTAGATATFSIAGVATNQPMRETQAGTYEGSYVIRRQDVFSPSPSVTAQLTSGSQSVRTALDQPLRAGTQPGASVTQLEILSPANNSRVGGTVNVTGRSTPQATISVNVSASNSLGIVGINRNLLSRDIQADAQGGFTFEFRTGLNPAGTRYEVNLTTANSQKQTLVLFQQ